MALFDFEADLKREMHELFAPYGFRIPYRSQLHEMITEYLTIHKKFIHIKPRKVLVNPEFEARLATHPKQKEIMFIRTALEQGMNINSFQSKRLFQPGFHDHLSYEWNIYHLHLSLKPDKKSVFVKQTDLLLFVYITDEEAILLETAKHEKGIFGDTRWQEILNRHFPESIAAYLETTISSISPKQDADTRQMCWDRGLTLLMTEVNDKVYVSPGIGRSMAGHSIIVMKTGNELIRWIHEISQQFTEHYDYLLRSFDLDPASSKLHITFSEKINITETVSGTALIHFPNRFALQEQQKEEDTQQ